MGVMGIRQPRPTQHEPDAEKAAAQHEPGMATTTNNPLARFRNDLEMTGMGVSGTGGLAHDSAPSGAPRQKSATQ